MRISDWSSDVCSSDLRNAADRPRSQGGILFDVGGIGDRQDRREYRIETEPPVDEEDAPVGQRRGIADRTATVRIIQETDRLRAGFGRIADVEPRLPPARLRVGALRDRPRAR